MFFRKFCANCIAPASNQRNIYVISKRFVNYYVCYLHYLPLAYYIALYWKSAENSGFIFACKHISCIKNGLLFRIFRKARVKMCKHVTYCFSVSYVPFCSVFYTLCLQILP